MEILQWVRVRGERWRVTDVRTYETSQLVTLASAQPSSSSARMLRVLAPFDDILPLATRVRPHVVRPRRWRRACRALLAADAPPGALRTATRARFHLLPHQLEPALAVLRGLGSRVLLADDVGLGKTIQAALIVAELMAARRADRVLVLTPSGLRDQWSAELSDRFGLNLTISDARTLRRAAAALPLDVNPWSTTPLVIASFDYVKRPEVLPAVAACRWDVLVVDEAHGVVGEAKGGESERYVAVGTLAARAAYVVMLSATPHSGEERAFAALRDIGSTGDALLVFRRTRQAIGRGAGRRVHTLRVGVTPSERHMFDALERYHAAVRAEQGPHVLALSVLYKRAFSSAWALAESVKRRLASLAEPPLDAERQLGLPLDDLDDHDGEGICEDAPPPWPAVLSLSDVSQERTLLALLGDAAWAAAIAQESKVRALQRLLRRTRESALVFTEYRDTAVHVGQLLGAAILHGGMDRDARQAALANFEARDCAVLVATDAAGQGLNLHRSCRLVVNLELPWNPMRLEQRIGRVDRIGQARRVHAVHLVGRQTAEIGILARLHDRVSAAQSAIDAPDPIGVPIGVASARDSRTDRARRERHPALEQAATLEASRIAFARSWATPDDTTTLASLDRTRWWVAWTRRHRVRAALAGRAVLIYRAFSENAAGETVASRIIPVMAAWLGTLTAHPPSMPAHVMDAWQSSVVAIERQFWAARLERERRLAALQAKEDPHFFQPDLYDRRAERQHAARQAQRDSWQTDQRHRFLEFARQAEVTRHDAELLLVLMP
ncbi:MAG TPA: helicase-related protein [Vicinamibacterales bacterium]|nr:helicase-related protein [Vicinamibacterales bacterium]